MAKILIIDDDDKIRMLMVRYLERLHYTVAEAENGKHGMIMLETFGPDLIITDILMPEMDGLEILMALRRQYPNIPVIAMSGGMRDVPVNFLHHRSGLTL
ncbi:MAG: response regulator [Pontiellaceae bacterium]|nr:response regulator [Pontiellaceae bacterium]MBN2784527.1 response regulator [Pontiellaceae bacterium]